MYKSLIKKHTTILAIFMSLIISCDNETNHVENEDLHDHAKEDNNIEKVHFSSDQVRSLGLKIDSLPHRNLSEFVEANGQLEVPPQNKAAVTAIFGSNVTRILVIEGEKIVKGQVIAFLSHPKLIELQTEYIQSWHDLSYIEKEYNRQKKLFDENVGSGKEFQKVSSEYNTTKAVILGYEAQLKLLGLDLGRLKNDKIYEEIPVISPIPGYIKMVNVKTGQYVKPDKEMFEIVNIEHIHADLMVFEKDMHKIRIDQKVKFRIESLPDKELEAKIYSVGKVFEQNPKAIHIHAEIENKQGLLIPGMYVRGRIMISNNMTKAIPEEGIIRDGDNYYIFKAEKVVHGEKAEWHFQTQEIIPGFTDDGWTEVRFLDPIGDDVQVVWNKAYYLFAELKKEDVGHAH